jgi:hypothetical protein
VGLLCNPVKCAPPLQVALYCGFLLDCRSLPEMCLPLSKRERATAMIHHILSHSIDWQLSRLFLAVIAGTLESMVEATSLCLGHTHLCQMHTIIHPEGHSPGAAIYYTRALPPRLVRADLQWWLTFLAQGRGRTARSTRSAVLIPSFGDGSGTGTGGTLGLPNQPLRMWMAQWSLTVFSFSSNWKELKTLQLLCNNFLRPMKLQHMALLSSILLIILPPIGSRPLGLLHHWAFMP